MFLSYSQLLRSFLYLQGFLLSQFARLPLPHGRPLLLPG